MREGEREVKEGGKANVGVFYRLQWDASRGVVFLNLDLALVIGG